MEVLEIFSNIAQIFSKLMKFNSKINNKHKINLPKIKNLKLKFMNNLIVRIIKYVGFQLIIYIYIIVTLKWYNDVNQF